MWCPKCDASYLELVSREWDYDDGELLFGLERYRCTQCNSTFKRDVTYVLEKEGELEE